VFLYVYGDGCGRLTDFAPRAHQRKSNALKWNTRTDNKVNFTLSCRPTKPTTATTTKRYRNSKNGETLNRKKIKFISVRYNATMMMMMMMLIPEAETISTPKKWAFSGGGFSFFFQRVGGNID